MNYVIDITRPRTKLAMLALGIEPEELVLKSLDDFGGRGVNEDVQRLRFNYHSRKLKEVVRQINSYIKEEAMRRIQSIGSSPKSPIGLFLTQSMPFEETVDEIAEIKKKEKNKVLESFNGINEIISASKAIEKKLQMGREARERIQSEVISRRSRLKKFKERQQENIIRIRQEQESKAESYKPAKLSNKKHRYSANDTSFQSYSKTLSDFNETDEEIEIKIQQFDLKMLKSKKNYEKNLQQKREAAAKFLEKSISHGPNEKSADLDVERIAKMIQKRKQVEARRHSLIIEQQENRQEIRKKHEQRRSIALQRIKEEEQLEQMRTQAIERRMEVSERILKQKHDSWMKELELKNELAKLKDEEALLNAERKKRIMYGLYRKYRREQVLEKQLVDKERIECMKKERKADVNKKMEISIRRMIEKEKTQRAMDIIRKSPDSLMAKKKLVELDIIKPKKP